MPISCPIKLPRLSAADMRELDYEVMRHALAAQREMGRLCDETIYQADLSARLAAAGLGPAPRETPVEVTFGTFAKTYELDVIAAGRAIDELKTVAALTPAHDAQLLNYLLLTNTTRGKLINFRPGSVESRFGNTTLDDAERRRFEIHRERWRGGEELCQWIVQMLRDWGTGLETALYLQAIVHRLGGEERVTQQVPMQRDGVPLGNQRLHLVDAESALFVTTFKAEVIDGHEAHLRRLLRLGPLARGHWVNIGRHLVHFATIERAGTLWAGK